jgi:hypothetical protein
MYLNSTYIFFKDPSPHGPLDDLLKGTGVALASDMRGIERLVSITIRVVYAGRCRTCMTYSKSVKENYKF